MKGSSNFWHPLIYTAHCVAYDQVCIIGWISSSSKKIHVPMFNFGQLYKTWLWSFPGSEYLDSSYSAIWHPLIYTELLLIKYARLGGHSQFVNDPLLIIIEIVQSAVHNQIPPMHTRSAAHRGRGWPARWARWPARWAWRVRRPVRHPQLATAGGGQGLFNPFVSHSILFNRRVDIEKPTLHATVSVHNGRKLILKYHLLIFFLLLPFNRFLIYLQDGVTNSQSQIWNFHDFLTNQNESCFTLFFVETI